MDNHTGTQMPLGMEVLFSAVVQAGTLSWVEVGLSIVTVVASLSFWFIASRRLLQKQELIPYRRSECVLGFIDVAAVFVCWLGLQVGTGVLLVMIVGPEAMSGGEEELFETHGVLLLYLSAAFGIASLVIGATYLVIRYRTTHSFGLRLDELKKQIGYGVAVFTMFFPVVLLVQYLLSLWVEYDHQVLNVLAENPNFVSIFGCWAAAVLAAPFVEEFLFRGVFHHWLERLSVSKINDDQLLIGGSSVLATGGTAAINAALDPPTAGLDEPRVVAPLVSDTDGQNPFRSPSSNVIPLQDEGWTNQRKFAYWPIFVSSLSFALLHLGQGLAPIPLFILSLGLGYLFRQTGSLIACITVHFLLNFYAMLVFTIMILLGGTP